jgi:hypothetical protein
MINSLTVFGKYIPISRSLLCLASAAALSCSLLYLASATKVIVVIVVRAAPRRHDRIDRKG